MVLVISDMILLKNFWHFSMCEALKIPIKLFYILKHTYIYLLQAIEASHFTGTF